MHGWQKNVWWVKGRLHILPALPAVLITGAEPHGAESQVHPRAAGGCGSTPGSGSLPSAALQTQQLSPALQSPAPGWMSPAACLTHFAGLQGTGPAWHWAAQAGAAGAAALVHWQITHLTGHGARPTCQRVSTGTPNPSLCQGQPTA